MSKGKGLPKTWVPVVGGGGGGDRETDDAFRDLFSDLCSLPVAASMPYASWRVPQSYVSRIATSISGVV